MNLPTTALGRLSLVGMAAFLVFMALFSIAVASGQRGGEEFFDNLWLTVPMLIAYFSAVGGFVAGAAALATQGERSIAVILATTVGLVVTMFGVLEVAFPH